MLPALSKFDPAPACHLVPRVEGSNGLADYSYRLSPSSTILEASRTGDLPAWETLGPTLILHYSGYGYAVNGAPAALVGQCESWRAADSRRRLLVVFHELFARQPPWRKGFWWAPWQRHLLRRLITICDGGLSTLELHTSWLRRQGLEPYATLPVPSNVGETLSPLPLAQRRRHLVVFGGRSQRQAAYAGLLREPQLLERLAITAIHDVGPPLEQHPRHHQLPVQCHGVLGPVQVAELLGQSLLGAVSYPLPFLAKSGIFAAFCAHGILPLVFHAGRTHGVQADGLRDGHHFITPAWLRAQAGPATAIAADTPIAAAAWRWYQPHRLIEQRRVLDAWITARL